MEGGGMVVNVKFGSPNIFSAPMILDTGAGWPAVTETWAGQLLQSGAAVEGEPVTSTLADGSRRSERSIIINAVTIGDHTVRNVRASVGGIPLLGLSVLRQIGKFTIDSDNNTLVFS
jgi:predicted aspartyl protease